MEELREIEKCLVSQIQAQCGDLKKVNAKELGEVVDMIKDLEEAIYYCQISEAMEKTSAEKEQRAMNINYYMEGNGRRMYDGQSRNTDSSYHTYVPYMEYAPYMMRDDKWREDHMGDKSSMSRRMYMEGKHYHGNNEQSMKELEHYIKDLGEDMTNMIEQSTPEEKQVLSSRLQQLATKINNSK